MKEAIIKSLFLYNVTLSKDEITAVCCNGNGTGKYHVKQRKSEEEEKNDKMISLICRL